MIDSLEGLIDDYQRSTHDLYYDAWAIGTDYWTEEVAKEVSKTADELRKSRDYVSRSTDQQRDEEASAWQAILDWFNQTTEDAEGLFGSFPPMISDFTIPGLEGLGEFFAGAWTTITEAINSGIAELGELLDSVREDLAEMIGDFLDFFAELLSMRFFSLLESVLPGRA